MGCNVQHKRIDNLSRSFRHAIQGKLRIARTGFPPRWVKQQTKHYAPNASHNIQLMATLLAALRCTLSLRADRKTHPDCRYSSSISKACTSVNGNRTCDTIRRIIRSCPGSRPEQIYEDATRDGGAPNSNSSSSSTAAAAAAAPPAVHGKVYQQDPVSYVRRLVLSCCASTQRVLGFRALLVKLKGRGVATWLASLRFLVILVLGGSGAWNVMEVPYCSECGLT